MWGLVFSLFLGLFGGGVPKYQVLDSKAPIGEIYYVYDDQATRTSAELVYLVGEADMTGPEGIAHYVEHLVAWSALPDDAKDAGRDFNASTYDTLTAYYMTSDSIDDVMSYLAATAAPIDLDHKYMVEEASIVEDEFQLRVAEDPYLPLYDEFTRATFQGTGLARSVIGEPNAIVNFDPQTALEVQDKFYHLEGARLLIYTPLSKGEVLKAINSAFADSQSAETMPRPLLDERPLYEGADEAEKTGANIRATSYNSALISPFPSQYSEMQIALYTGFANDILSSNKEGMLARKLEYDDKIFTSLNLGYSRLIGQLGIQLQMSARAKAGKSAEELSDYYQEWLSEIDTHRDSIDAVIAQSKENYQRDLENWKGEDEYGFIKYQIYQNPVRPFTFEQFAEAAQNVTSDEVIEFMKTLGAQNRTTDRIWKGSPS